jgi:hypothetical protein
VFLAAFFSASMPAQEKSLGDDRDRGKEMLSKIKDDLKRYYYDPKLRGIDVDARFKEAAAKIDEARSLGQIMGIIGTVLGELNDSHTYFIPPLFALEVDYGWTMLTYYEQEALAKKADREAELRHSRFKSFGDQLLSYAVSLFGVTLDRLRQRISFASNRLNQNKKLSSSPRISINRKTTVL